MTIGERVLNGNFADGLDGWTTGSTAPAGHWHANIEVERDPPPSIRVDLGVYDAEYNGWIEQVVDLTGVDHITFAITPAVNYWRKPYGWCRFYIDDVIAYESLTYDWEYTWCDIGCSAWEGNHTLRWEIYTGGFDGGFYLGDVSAIGPDPTPPPVANFSAEPVIGLTPLEVQFVDLSTNTPTYWIWDFDDGWAVGVKNPTHVYKKSGAYSPTLTVTNAAGSDTITKWSFILVAWTVERYKPMETIQIGPDPGTEPIVLPLPPCWIDGDPPP